MGLYQNFYSSINFSTFHFALISLGVGQYAENRTPKSSYKAPKLYFSNPEIKKCHVKKVQSCKNKLLSISTRKQVLWTPYYSQKKFVLCFHTLFNKTWGKRQKSPLKRGNLIYVPRVWIATEWTLFNHF